MTGRKSIIPHVVAVNPRSLAGLYNPDGVVVKPHSMMLDMDDHIILLSLEVIERANRVLQMNLVAGESGETVTIQGLDIASLHPGDVLAIGKDAVVVVDSLGQHSMVVLTELKNPPLLQQHGVYVTVQSSGVIHLGDSIH